MERGRRAKECLFCAYKRRFGGSKINLKNMEGTNRANIKIGAEVDIVLRDFNKLAKPSSGH